MPQARKEATARSTGKNLAEVAAKAKVELTEAKIKEALDRLRSGERRQAVAAALGISQFKLDQLRFDHGMRGKDPRKPAAAQTVKPAPRRKAK